MALDPEVQAIHDACREKHPSSATAWGACISAAMRGISEEEVIAGIREVGDRGLHGQPGALDAVLKARASEGRSVGGGPGLSPLGYAAAGAVLGVLGARFIGRGAVEGAVVGAAVGYGASFVVP